MVEYRVKKAEKKMLKTQCLLLILVYFKATSAIEEDNLRNALNSIENRQRQYSKNYYPLPIKDPERPLQLDDDNLMFLDSAPSDYDVPYPSRIGPVVPKPSKNYRPYDDDRLGGSYDDDGDGDDYRSNGDEYQKALSERLLEQVMLDLLKYEDDQQTSPPAAASRHRPQKKSFFREREINDIPDSLQNLYPNAVAAAADADEAARGAPFYSPTSFRERVKSKPHPDPLRRAVKPYRADADDDLVDAADYLNGVDPLWRKYEGPDPDSMTEEDADLLLKYLTDKDFRQQQQQQDFEPQTYTSEYESRARSKRYWLGGSLKSRNKYSIRKRSAEPRPAGVDRRSSALVAGAVARNATDANNGTATANETAATGAASTTPSPPPSQVATKAAKRGQREMPMPMPIHLMWQKPLSVKKKSVDWSNYFGVDKRSAKLGRGGRTVPPDGRRKNDVLLDQYIQSYILQSVRNSAFNNRAASDNYRYLPKRDAGGANPFAGLANGRRVTADDIRAAEDWIVDQMVKYTGAHQGITDPAELRRVRQKLIEQLWVAYNLQRIRNNLYGAPESEEMERSKKEHQHSPKKRVAVKKENAELIPNETENPKKNKHNGTTLSRNTSKKNSIDYNKYRYDIGDADECPVLNQIMDQCLQISIEVKDRDRAFTPYCTLHHLCHICGAKQDSLSCDLSFFSETNAMCADEPECRYTANRVLYLIKNQPVTSYLSAKDCDSCISQILPYNVEI